MNTAAKQPCPQGDNRVRVLYSFPHKLGADRICFTAWQQVNGLAAAGADVLLFPGVLHRRVFDKVCTRPTLARGKFRIPYKLLGRIRSLALHDYIVSRRLEKLAGKIDIVHAWPSGALRTLLTAERLGIPAVLERPNTHTRFAMEVVQKECRRLGIELPVHNEYAPDAKRLQIEEEEFRRAYRLLCPSDFVVESFIRRGFNPDNLVRHSYGYDSRVYHPATRTAADNGSFRMLFAGVCAVRKGLHFALEAWLSSPAHRDGTFLIAGAILPEYARKLAPLLAHPSVRVLGHRKDVSELMRQSDILVLPSIEEGSPLVCAEAIGSGCVPVVSEACNGTCRHLENALVHPIGDVQKLTDHITLLYQDRALLDRLRQRCIEVAPQYTWSAAGKRLLQVYREVIASYRAQTVSEHSVA